MKLQSFLVGLVGLAASTVAVADSNIFVIMQDPDQLLSLNEQSLEVETRLTFDMERIPVALAAADETVAVALRGRQECGAEGAMDLIDAETGQLDRSISLGFAPASITLSEDGQTAFIAKSCSPEVAVVRLPHSKIDTITFDGLPAGRAVVDEEHSLIFLVGTLRSSVLALDLNAGDPVASLPIPGSTDLAMVPGADEAYVTTTLATHRDSDGAIFVLDLASLSITERIFSSLDSFPRTLDLAPDHTFAIATDVVASGLLFVDTVTNVVTPMDIERPTATAISPSEPKAYVAAFGPRKIYVVNTDEHTVASAIDLEGSPLDLVVSSGMRRHNSDSGCRIQSARTGSLVVFWVGGLFVAIVLVVHRRG
jgi:DNA-binding beta-propeller fold protein YncE